MTANSIEKWSNINALIRIKSTLKCLRKLLNTGRFLKISHSSIPVLCLIGWFMCSKVMITAHKSLYMKNLLSSAFKKSYYLTVIEVDGLLVQSKMITNS